MLKKTPGKINDKTDAKNNKTKNKERRKRECLPSNEEKRSKHRGGGKRKLGKKRKQKREK